MTKSTTKTRGKKHYLNLLDDINKAYGEKKPKVHRHRHVYQKESTTY